MKKTLTQQGRPRMSAPRQSSTSEPEFSQAQTGDTLQAAIDASPKMQAALQMQKAMDAGSAQHPNAVYQRMADRRAQMADGPVVQLLKDTQTGDSIDVKMIGAASVEQLQLWYDTAEREDWEDSELVAKILQRIEELSIDAEPAPEANPAPADDLALEADSVPAANPAPADDLAPAADPAPADDLAPAADPVPAPVVDLSKPPKGYPQKIQKVVDEHWKEFYAAHQGNAHNYMTQLANAAENDHITLTRVVHAMAINGTDSKAAPASLAEGLVLIEHYSTWRKYTPHSITIEILKQILQTGLFQVHKRDTSKAVNAKGNSYSFRYKHINEYLGFEFHNHYNSKSGVAGCSFKSQKNPFGKDKQHVETSDGLALTKYLDKLL